MNRLLDDLSLRNMDQCSILNQSRIEGHEGMILVVGIAGQVGLHPIRILLQHMQWPEAGALIERGIEQAIDQKRVTYDFERQMQGATKVSTSGFADAIIENMNS